MELELNQMDCEVLIRKKEALPQPSAAAPVFYAQPSTEQAMVSPQLPPSNVPAPASHIPSTPNPVPAPPALAKPKSSHPPVKCPMAGTFYRASAPGATPFVKVSAYNASCVFMHENTSKNCSIEFPCFSCSF